MSQESGGAFLVGFAIGTAVGAGIALVLAPQSGEETRAQIRDKTLEYKDWAEEGVLEARSQAEKQIANLQKQVSTLQEQVGTLQNQGKDMLEKGRQGAAEAFGKAKG